MDKRLVQKRYEQASVIVWACLHLESAMSKLASLKEEALLSLTQTEMTYEVKHLKNADLSFENASYAPAQLALWKLALNTGGQF